MKFTEVCYKTTTIMSYLYILYIPTADTTFAPAVRDDARFVYVIHTHTHIYFKYIADYEKKNCLHRYYYM